MSSQRLKQYGNLSGEPVTSRQDSRYNGGAWTTTYTTTQSPFVDYYYHQGFDTANYYQRLRTNRLLPITDWLQYQVQGKIHRSTHSHSYTPSAGNTYEYRSTPGDISYWAPDELWMLSPSAVSTRVKELGFNTNAFDWVQIAASKIYSRGWDGLTFVAELHKVASMFKGFVRRLLSYGSATDLAKLWLEGRYGWRILAYDMQDISNLIGDIYDTAGITRYKERAGYGEQYSDYETFEIETGVGTVEYYVQTVYSASVRGTVIADIRPPHIGINPITTAWELITFSFVIDWVLNVGRALEALSFLTLSSEYTAGGGTLITANRFCQSTGITTPNTNRTLSHDFYATSSCTLTRRSPTTVSAIPSLKPNLDALKVTDLIALFMGFLTRR